MATVNMEPSENVDHQLSLKHVYKDYPKHCLPDKLNNPTGSKAKDVQYEPTNESMYKPEANMVVYRVTAADIPSWISSFGIIYYDTYGKQSNYTVSWYDEPLDWRSKRSEKIYICIDLATSDIPLLYTLTFHINIGVVQVQGNYIIQFTKKDFPTLKELKQRVTSMYKTTVEVTSTSGAESDSDDYNTLNTTMLEPNEETNPKELIMKMTEKNIDIDSNNKNVDLRVHVYDNFCQTESTSVVPLGDQNKSSIFAEILNRMESMFANSLEKITNQQTTC